MIVNFVDDAYLEKFYPDIINYRRGGQNDYAGQIATAFEYLLDDLVARNIKPRLCMIPLDMNRTSSTGGIEQLTKITTTASVLNGMARKGTNQRRAFVSVIAKPAGDRIKWTLRGSNKQAGPTDPSDSSWEDILSFEWLEDDDASDKMQSFVQEYRWYAYQFAHSVGSGQIIFKSALYETIYDRLIAYKALEIIASSWKTGQNPQWDERKDAMKSEYDELMEVLRINYDRDEDGEPQELETGGKMGASFGSISAIS